MRVFLSDVSGLLLPDSRTSAKTRLFRGLRCNFTFTMGIAGFAQSVVLSVNSSIGSIFSPNDLPEVFTVLDD